MDDEKNPIGCLLLHGFTSSLDSLRGNIDWLNKDNIPYSMPVLRGHGGTPDDLLGVTWNEWYADAETAYDELLKQCSQVLIIGFSMGGLVALELGIRKADHICGQILIAPALRFTSKLLFLLPILDKLFKFWPTPNPFNDQQCAKSNTNYNRFPIDSFKSLYSYSQYIERKLDQVSVSTLIIHSRRDTIISPISAEIIFNSIEVQDKKVIWFEKSGHEMLQDMEADVVITTIRDYVLEKKESLNDK